MYSAKVTGSPNNPNIRIKLKYILQLPSQDGCPQTQHYLLQMCKIGCWWLIVVIDIVV